MQTQTSEISQATLTGAGRTESAAALVRNLTHELRQPLSVIETAAFYAEMILMEGDSRVAEQLQKIQATVQQMNTVLCDLVYYAMAVPAGGERMPLSSVVMDAVGDAAACGEGADMEWHDLTAAPAAQMNGAQARHMMRNILAVFLHLSAKEHVLQISLTEAADTVHLDTTTQAAAGLLRGPAELLFEPFTPLLPSGLSLTLAAVRRIAEAHGGGARFLAQRDASITLRISLPAR